MAWGRKIWIVAKHTAMAGLVLMETMEYIMAPPDWLLDLLSYPELTASDFSRYFTIGTLLILWLLITIFDFGPLARELSGLKHRTNQLRIESDELKGILNQEAFIDSNIKHWRL